MTSSAFNNVDEKVGKKGQMAPTKIPDVETVPCPKRSDAAHVIENSATGVSRCIWCKGTWADLDGQIRKAALAARKVKQEAGA